MRQTIDMRIVRWAGVIAAAAVALYVGFGLIAGPFSMAALILLSALMAIGTLLARQPIGPGALVAMGVLGPRTRACDWLSAGGFRPLGTSPT